MDAHTWDRWRGAVQVLAVGVVVIGLQAVRGDPWADLAIGAGVFAVAAGWISPLRPGRHTPHPRAIAEAEPDDVIVYWRPGCIHCTKLRWDLRGHADDVIWVNVYRDDAAAQAVRSMRDGNLTTPTTVTGTGDQIEADADVVLAHVGPDA